MPKRYQQPQAGWQIDWSNSITRGLIEVYNPTSTASAIDNTVYGTSGTPTKTVNRLGQATYAAQASAAGKTRAFGKLTSAAECAIFGVVTPIGTLGATQAFGGCASTASANPLFLIGTGSTTASQLSFRVRNAAGTNQEVLSGSGVLVAGTPIVVAGSRSEAQNFHRVYANGLQVGAAAASAIGATAYNTFAAHGLLRSAFGLQVGSEVNLLMAWNRALTAEEVKSLSANPWQIFAPASRQIWVPSTGGGAATATPSGVSATWAAGIPTATGAALAAPLGVSATGSVGTPIATTGTTALLAGVSATGSVGTPTATGAALASPSGVSGIWSVGTPTAVGGSSGTATVLPAGVEAVGAVGTLIATGAAWCVPGGVGAVGSVGTPVAVGDPVINVAGALAGSRAANVQAGNRQDRIQTSSRASRVQTSARPTR